MYHPEEILAWTVFEDEINGVGISEGLLHPAEELRSLASLICNRELLKEKIDFLLVLEVFDAFCLINGVFGDAFQGAQLIFVNHQFDGPEFARAYFNTRQGIQHFLNQSGWGASC